MDCDSDLESLVDDEFDLRMEGFSDDELPNDISDKQIDQLMEAWQNQSGSGLDLEKYLEIDLEYRSNAEKWKTEQTVFSVRFKHLDKVADIHQLLTQVCSCAQVFQLLQSINRLIDKALDGAHVFQLLQSINHLIDKAIDGAQPSDGIVIKIIHRGLDKPILVSFMRRRLLNAEAIVRYIEHIVQSNQAFSLDEDMEWQFTRITNPTGGADIEETRLPKHLTRRNLDEWLASEFVRFKAVCS